MTGSRSAPDSPAQESAMDLIGQMAAMQTQFFEHSQLQTRLIMKMLDHLERSQQASVRQDLARIEEIGRELDDIKLQLAEPAPVETSPANKDRSAPPADVRPIMPATGTKTVGEFVPYVDTAPASSLRQPPGESVVASDSSASRPMPSGLSKSDQPAATANTGPQHRSVASPQPPIAPPTSTADAHAFLSQRMASLAQERNSRWRHILNLFAGKADGNRDE